MTKLMATTGFVTNSSSQVCWFDPKILEHPEVQAFIEAYGIKDGYVGKDLWHRGACGSVLVTKEQKEAANKQMRQDSDFCPGVTINPDGQETVVIYGDEYPGDLAYEFAHLITKVHGKGTYSVPHQEYN